MKKLFAMLMALVMVLGCTAAFADGVANEVVHAASSPAYVSEQEAKITIVSVHDSSQTGDTQTLLPSEYHVIINWDIQDGVYKATASDSSEEGGFKNFSWNCSILDYEVNSWSGDDEDDPRQANWTTEPRVRFEVVNNSTPDLRITATASLKGNDTWNEFIKSNPIATQNSDVIKTQTINPVSIANMGKGKLGYSVNAQSWGATCENEYEYTYEFNWDYDKLNAKALALYKAGGSPETRTNTYVVTIAAGGKTTAAPATGGESGSGSTGNEP